MKLLALVAAGVLLALALIAWTNRGHFTYQPGALPAEGFAALAGRPGWRAEPLAVAPGIALRGLVRPPRAAGAPWLLFFPGNGPDLLREGQVMLESLAGDADLGLAVWSYRGFDGSPGTPGMLAFAADAERQHAHLRGQFGAGRIHLVGFSLGTALALRLATLLAARGTPAERVALLSAFDEIAVRRPGALGRFLPPERYVAMDWTAIGTARALLVQGEADPVTPLAAARRLTESLGAGATLLPLPGRAHADWLGDPAALAGVRAFLVAP